jgi:hypothetical protein
LDAQIAKLAKGGETIAAHEKELEVARKAQSEVETLRKELVETRQSLALKESNCPQPQHSNTLLNDELALVMSERKWLRKEGIPLVT